MTQQASTQSALVTTTPRPGSGEMFDRIADRYDLLNRIISLGIDQGWRRRTVRSLGLKPGQRALDLATGTADLAIMIARMCPEVDVIGIDPSRNMLAVGEGKIVGAKLDTRVRLEVGDAQALELEDDSIDAITIAFGIRNVPDRLAALREMARVTRPGGVIALLELGEPRSGLLGPLARFHVHTIVPWLGAMLSGAKEYRYLQTSIAAFPDVDAFCALMREAGLEDVRVEPLTFGVCHLYLGRAPKAREELS